VSQFLKRRRCEFESGAAGGCSKECLDDDSFASRIHRVISFRNDEMQGLMTHPESRDVTFTLEHCQKLRIHLSAPRVAAQKLCVFFIERCSKNYCSTFCCVIPAVMTLEGE